MAYISQPFFLAANTTYNTRWSVKSSVANPGCPVYVGIGDIGWTRVWYVDNRVSSLLKPTWLTVTGRITTGVTNVDGYYHIRVVCSSIQREPRTYYFDDIVFEPAI
jgi:hypothetical protein